MKASELEVLKEFVARATADPQLLHDRDLGFLRAWLTSLGATIPAEEHAHSHGHGHSHGGHACSGHGHSHGSTAAAHAEAPASSEDEVVEEEEALDLDMTGVIPADSDAPAPMGRSGVEPSDEEREEARALVQAGSEALAAGDAPAALRALSQAINLDASSARLMEGRRREEKKGGLTPTERIGERRKEKGRLRADACAPSPSPLCSQAVCSARSRTRPRWEAQRGNPRCRRCARTQP